MTLEEGTAKFIAFQKIQNPFIGILAGIIGATCYNKFKSTKLPNFLAFFSGKRCVEMCIRDSCMKYSNTWALKWMRLTTISQKEPYIQQKIHLLKI